MNDKKVAIIIYKTNEDISPDIAESLRNLNVPKIIS